MDWQFGGIPLHPLFVHLTSVAVPVAALTAIVVAVWPAARRWLAVGAPIIGLVALVSVPLATSSGEWLEHREQETALLERHTELADVLLPWSIAVFVLLLLWWGWHRFGTARVTSGGALRAVRIVGPVLLLAVGVVSMIEVVVIGHAGAESVWKG
ncbi:MULTISPECIES: DUF2231 domain-containing protein [unclassified Curtobacterium]|uniref:DUF2231 domain-containing protein n=1 Tax=unclassified Curtobacterium TaxID=257496 RepID=UPI000F48D679|nr:MULTISPECIES: DUF2231 domain-containing protein [unclassified Curtobacterium]ROQ06138.1 hypothetical protein EDF41_2952 [Curtobacterium sp. PhB171]ROQ22715.1 hypothetical protein EDF40_2720 [Curtobacterium sp. PhB170]ROS34333.1 hypothetical protein EDF25_2775 [Curtobacterium sp. PhB131]ROS74273.1 hypothetical protein EDF30_0045 [Curtobacterium sp. PhB141]